MSARSAEMQTSQAADAPGRSPNKVRRRISDMDMPGFIMWAVENGPFDGFDLDGASVQAKAIECGIIEPVIYDPEKHGNSEWAEPGDTWYIFTEEFEANFQR